MIGAEQKSQPCLVSIGIKRFKVDILLRICAFSSGVRYTVVIGSRNGCNFLIISRQFPEASILTSRKLSTVESPPLQQHNDHIRCIDQSEKNSKTYPSIVVDISQYTSPRHQMPINNLAHALLYFDGKTDSIISKHYSMSITLIIVPRLKG